MREKRFAQTFGWRQFGEVSLICLDHCFVPGLAFLRLAKVLSVMFLKQALWSKRHVLGRRVAHYP
jgi:hypothetical protein